MPCWPARFFLLAAALIGLRATNTRGEPAAPPDHIHAGHERIPAPELTDQKPYPHHYADVARTRRTPPGQPRHRALAQALTNRST